MRRALALLSLWLAAVPAAAQQPTPASVRADIAADLPDNMAGEISAADLRGVLEDLVDLIPTTATIRGQTAPWAQAVPTGTIPTAQLAAGGATGDVLRRSATGQAWVTVTIPGTADIDARIAPPAREVNPSGTFNPGRIPGLPATRITSGTLADARIPSAIARDSELPAAPATWAQAGGRTGQMPFAALPICANGEILKRGPTAWACGADNAGSGGGVTIAQVNARIEDFAETGATGFLPGSRVAAGGTPGQLVQLGAGGALQWASIAPRSVSFYDTRIDSRADARNPSGTLAQARIPSLPASRVTSGTFAAARIPLLPASQISSGTLAQARIPSLPASRITSGTFAAARIPDLDGAKITTGEVAAARIDGALTRDGELPDALLIGDRGGRGPLTATGSQVLCRFRDSSPAAQRGDFDWCTVRQTFDASALTMSMSRTRVDDAARMITIASSSIDADHDLSVSGGCLVVGTNGAGKYDFGAYLEATPNRDNTAAPNPDSGPHRAFGIVELRRTRASVTHPVYRNSPYVRGAQRGSSPASQWVAFDGFVIAQAADRYCIWYDGTRTDSQQTGASTGAYLTITGGEIGLVTERIVVEP